jgi:Family of unknown function (DUF5995)
VTPTLEELLRQRPPGRIVDVVARMEAIQAALPPADGVAAFNRLYLEVTRGVLDALRPGRFQDGRFLRWLDVVFANLYFEALRTLVLRTGAPPRAWAPLVEHRGRAGVLPLQFALAGMNAHINRDLPVALVDTCRSLRIELGRPSPQYDDFCLVNELLETAQERVKGVFARGTLGRIDVALGREDDVLAMWNVRAAREAAWTNAEVLWALRRLPEVQRRFLRALDRTVGFAGRGLLRPLG